jgi:hypothetical protein
MKELLTAVFGTIVAALLIHEAQAWFPHICKGLISLAVKRLPKRQRDRYFEEWHGHIAQVPGNVMKIWDALGFVFGADKMFPRWHRSIAHRKALAQRLVANRATIRMLDIALAGFMLVFLAPLLAIVGFVNSFSGPVFWRTYAKAPNGAVVPVLRFRTFRLDNAGDRVMSPFGRLIRRTLINELPQLVSVFVGHMSFITVEKHGLVTEHLSLLKGTRCQGPVRTMFAYILTIWRTSWLVLINRI